MDLMSLNSVSRRSKPVSYTPHKSNMLIDITRVIDPIVQPRSIDPPKSKHVHIYRANAPSFFSYPVPFQIYATWLPPLSQSEFHVQTLDPSLVRSQVRPHRKQFSPQHRKRNTGLWMPCLSAVTVPPARRPPKGRE